MNTTQERVIVPMPFQGFAQTVINADGKIAYHQDETIEEYLSANPQMKVMTWEEYDKLHTDYYTRPFTPITEKEYFEGLECLPPKRWHDLTTDARYNVFFCAEAMSGSMHSIYLFDRQTEKYFCGMMSIFSNDIDIQNKINSEI